MLRISLLIRVSANYDLAFEVVCYLKFKAAGVTMMAARFRILELQEWGSGCGVEGMSGTVSTPPPPPKTCFSTCVCRDHEAPKP